MIVCGLNARTLNLFAFRLASVFLILKNKNIERSKIRKCTDEAATMVKTKIQTVYSNTEYFVFEFFFSMLQIVFVLLVKPVKPNNNKLNGHLLFCSTHIATISQSGSGSIYLPI